MARLWLDAHSYGARLLRDGVEPWSDPETLGPLYGEMAGLLAPWRLVLPLEPVILPGLPDSADALARAEVLDALVGSAAFQRPLDTGLHTLAHSRAAPMCAPRLPGPSLIMGAQGDEDTLDDTVAALGQVLRQATTVLGGHILLDEPDAAAREACGPLRRIAEHAGVELHMLGEALPRVDWVALDRLGVDAEALVTVPADARPETVLETLKAAEAIR